jgi:hypothetical protein
MDSFSQRDPRVLWSFWLTSGLAATGGIAPLLLAAGGTNRLAGVVIPFAIAAMAMAVNALTYRRGRPLATSLYFLAGIAMVYGMLAMVAVPLRLAVLGTCPPAPALCPAGFERPFTSGESAGFAVGIAMGTIAILVGFFGLLMLFRIRPTRAEPPPTRRAISEAPPDRRDSAQTPVVTPAAPVAAEPPPRAEPEPEAPPAAVPEAEPSLSALPPAAVAPKPPRSKPRVKREPKPQAELPPPAEPLELPAPETPPELPPDAGSST